MPAFALLCIVATLAAMPVGHSLVRLLHEIPDQWLWSYANVAVGLLGFACVWAGLRQRELQACVLGFIGANLMFTGFFEFTFALFAEVFAVQPLVSPTTGNVLLTPGLQINEASFFILLPLFLLFYANRQVRCTMIVWLRRKLRLDTGPPTEPSRDRPYARIVASETLFVIWMIYAISLITMDPRVLGPTHWFSMGVYLWFFIWPLYLSYRIVKLKVPGAIFRYAVPIGVLFWAWVETLASMDLIHEYYLQPLDYPLATAVTAALAAGTLLVIYRRARQSSMPSAEPSSQTAAGSGTTSIPGSSSAVALTGAGSTGTKRSSKRNP